MDVSGNLDGHLGEGTRIKGTLRFEGSVRIDGRFSGKIVSPATLILGPEAEVDGEVQVAELAVHGKLRGKVEATNKVTIHDEGKVEAEVKTQSFVIEPGAFFQGQCEMERDAEPPKARKAESGNGDSSGSPSKPGSSRGSSRPGSHRGGSQKKEEKKQSKLLNKKDLHGS